LHRPYELLLANFLKRRICNPMPIVFLQPSNSVCGGVGPRPDQSSCHIKELAMDNTAGSKLFVVTTQQGLK